jgi:hypothetical protein
VPGARRRDVPEGVDAVRDIRDARPVAASWRRGLATVDRRPETRAKLGDVGLGDDRRLGPEDSSGGQHALVTPTQRREDPDRVVPVLERVLADGADDLARGDRIERRVLLVERRHLHRADTLRALERLQARGRVVGEEPDHPREVLVLDEDVLRVGLGRRRDEVVGAGRDDLEAVADEHLARSTGGISAPAAGREAKRREREREER